MRLTWWAALSPSTRGHVLALVAACALVLAALAFDHVILGLVAGGYAALALDGGVKHLLEQLRPSTRPERRLASRVVTAVRQQEHAGGLGG